MIIFYEKETGHIKGTVDGRIHPKEQLLMSMEGTEKLVVSWKPVRYFTRLGNPTTNPSEYFTADYEPDCDQKELFIALDKHPIDVYKYRVDPQTKQLVLK
jgi:hypothetical protein